MTVDVRALTGHAQMSALAECWRTIWNHTDAQAVPKEVLVAGELAGHQILGAFDGETLIGGSWGFFTADGSLHSHITGVLPAYRGVAGYALKMAQRDWCLARDISTVVWTFDPMIARNAAFNLRKLGATGVGFLPDLYGPMGDAFNAGQPTDRMQVRWDLTAPPRTAPPTGSPAAAAEHVEIPADYLGMRASDPSGASAARERVSAQIRALFDGGYHAVWYDAERDYVFTSARPSR